VVTPPALASIWLRASWVGRRSRRYRRVDGLISTFRCRPRVGLSAAADSDTAVEFPKHSYVAGPNAISAVRPVLARRGRWPVYPDLLGTYGDGGKWPILARRAAWRGADVDFARKPVRPTAIR
jgi:hypothetical protein